MNSPFTDHAELEDYRIQESETPLYPQAPSGGAIAYLTLTGEKQGQIKGNVALKGKEGAIAVYQLHHEIASPRDAATGAASGKRIHKPLAITKEIDTASVKLLNAMVTNELLKQVVINFWQPGSIGARGGDASGANYYRITLTNAVIASISQDLPNINSPAGTKYPFLERVEFVYQKIEWQYLANLPGVASDDIRGARELEFHEAVGESEWEENSNQLNSAGEYNETELYNEEGVLVGYEHFAPEADPVLFYEDVKIRTGESIIGLAAEYGFDPDDWLKIWNDPKNAALKTKRKLSTNIKEGDILYIPIKWRIISDQKLVPQDSSFVMRAVRSGKEGARLDWVQTVYAHNQPQFPVKPFPSFSVDLPSEDDLPFYWTQADYDHLTLDSNHNVIEIFRKEISDIPNRRPPTPEQGVTTWRAVTSLCVVTHKRVSIWNTFVWGVNFNANGINTKYEIRAATDEEINGHLNLLRRKTGKSNTTFTAMGWTFRDRNKGNV